MSIEVMNNVWSHSAQKGSELLLLLAIADNANNKGEAYPGIAYLARKVRMSRRQIQRLVQDLNKTEELAVVWGGAGPKDAHFYIILIGKSEEEIRHIKEQTAKINAKRKSSLPARKVAQENKGDILSPLAEGDEKGDISGKKGVKSGHKGDIAVSPEPLINREQNRQGEPGSAAEKPPDGLPLARAAPPPVETFAPTQTGKTPAGSISLEIQLFKAVTGRLPSRDQRQLVIRAWKDKAYSLEVLLPYWEAWVARDHKRTSLGWLDWVERGEIPRPWGQKTQAAEEKTEPKGFRSIRQVLEEYRHGNL